VDAPVDAPEGPPEPAPRPDRPKATTSWEDTAIFHSESGDADLRAAFENHPEVHATLEALEALLGPLTDEDLTADDEPGPDSPVTPEPAGPAVEVGEPDPLPLGPADDPTQVLPPRPYNAPEDPMEQPPPRHASRSAELGYPDEPVTPSWAPPFPEKPQATGPTPPQGGATPAARQAPAERPRWRSAVIFAVILVLAVVIGVIILITAGVVDFAAPLGDSPVTTAAGAHAR
jgi:hypothetical protein